MTRKRFIKLVMSYEIQRNEAIKMADMVKEHRSYEEMFRTYHQYLWGKMLMNRANRGFKWFAEGIRQTAKTITETLSPTIQSLIKSVAGEADGDSQNQS